MTGVCMTGVCIQATFYEWNAIDVVYHERQRDHDDQKTDHSHQVSDVKDPLAFWFLLLMCVGNHYVSKNEKILFNESHNEDSSIFLLVEQGDKCHQEDGYEEQPGQEGHDEAGGVLSIVHCSHHQSNVGGSQYW